MIQHYIDKKINNFVANKTSQLPFGDTHCMWHCPAHKLHNVLLCVFIKIFFFFFTTNSVALFSHRVVDSRTKSLQEEEMEGFPPHRRQMEISHPQHLILTNSSKFSLSKGSPKKKWSLSQVKSQCKFHITIAVNI